MHTRPNKRVYTPYLITVGLMMILFGAVSPAQAAWPSGITSPFWWFWPVKRETPKIQPQPQNNKTQEANNKPMIPDIIQEPIIPAAEAAINKPVVAGWLTSWDEASFSSFKNNLDTLTEVHPFVYTIGADGVSVVPDEGDWHKNEVMRLAKQHNIKVIPTISGDVNFSDLMLNDPAKQSAHIAEIVKIVEDNNYDGFDIDYEGFMNGYNRDVYVAFMQELSEQLHARHKTVAIAIEAFNRQQNWEELGKAVDRFMIMGYDYHAAKTTEVGPIGPANWLSEVIEYAATRVPREKIVLGLGTYGYSWIYDGAQYTSTAVGYHDALDIAKETGNTIQHDADNTPYFTYDRGQGLRYLYFEDAASTKPKLDLVGKHKIAGIAYWRLGTEDPKVWEATKGLLANK